MEVKMSEWEYVNRLRLAMNMPLSGNLKSKSSIWKLNHEEASRAFDQYPGKYIVTGMFIPCELFTAIDYPFIPTETVSVSIGMMNYNRGLIERMNHRFDGMQLCSPIEVMLGMYEENMLPPPGAVVLSSYMCEDAQKMFEMIARKYNCPTYFLDIPFNISESSHEYIKSQLAGLIRFLEDYTGKKMNPDSLRETVRYSNLANALRSKIFNLRAKHQLTQVSDVFPIYPLFTRFGRKDVVEILNNIYNEMLDNIENGNVYNPDFRVIWLGMIPLLSNDLMKNLYDQYSIGVALEENSIFSLWDNVDEENPLDGLAGKYVSYHPLGTVERRINAINKFIDEFGIDGVIHFSHMGCRVYNGGVYFIEKEMKRRGIPFVELSGDIIDRRNFQEEVLKLRIETFLELLRTEKERGGILCR
jgi:benzoyl-CoA reductase/2-hydroxyglutaryl-CoA dehydratase subunit BcrC/BadD/HgdB